MPKRGIRKCYFGCLPFKGTLRHFPTHTEDPRWRWNDVDKFEKWKQVLSESDQEKGDFYIYRNISICDNHFEDSYITVKGRLTKNAVPTLNIILIAKQIMEEVKKPCYKYCLVPECKNTTISTRDKVFFRMPRDAKLRKQWCKMMKRDDISPLTVAFCCEDHFNVKEDTVNYIEYSIMKQKGEKRNLRLKKGVVPHTFSCQKPYMPPPGERMAVVKRQRIALVNEALSDYAIKRSNILEIVMRRRSNIGRHTNRAKRSRLERANETRKTREVNFYRRSNETSLDRDRQRELLQRQSATKRVMRGKSNLGRHTIDAMRTRLIRANEDDEKTKIRLRKLREANFYRRSNETSVERDLRLSLNRERQRMRKQRQSATTIRGLPQGHRHIKKKKTAIPTVFLTLPEVPQVPHFQVGEDVKTSAVSVPLTSQQDVELSLIRYNIKVEPETLMGKGTQSDREEYLRFKALNEEVMVKTEPIEHVEEDLQHEPTTKDVPSVKDGPSGKDELYIKDVPSVKDEPNDDELTDDAQLKSTMSQRDVEQSGTQYKFTTQNLHIKIEPLTHNEDTTHVHTQHMDTGTSEEYLRFKELSEEVIIKEEPVEQNEFYLELEPMKDEPKDDTLSDTQVKSAVPSENATVSSSQDLLAPKQKKKLFKCDICKKAFILLSKLKTHKRKHMCQKPYRCNYCNNNFRCKAVLICHIRKHTGEKPFKCKICEKTFTQLGNLTTHARTHTGVKPYKCTTCEKSFNQYGTLQAHILTHSGEKYYKCNICEKTFNQHSNLKNHMRTHTGEKPYKCSTCNKAMSDPSSLITHMRIHTGEKPYKCDICEKTFRLSHNLKRHLGTHKDKFTVGVATSNLPPVAD